MGVIIIEIILFVIGIILCIWGSNDFDGVGRLIIGMTLVAFIGLALFVEFIVILLKPLDYKNFKIEYETIKQTITTSQDIRDTNYTQKIIEINTEINVNKEFSDNQWVGIFYSKQIGELEILKKGE